MKVSYCRVGCLYSGIPQETADYVFEQSHSLLLHQLCDHIAQYRSDGIEALVSSANIVQTNVVQQYFLDNKYGDGLAQLRAGLHDAKAERNDLRGKEEVDHIGRIVLHKGTDDTERSEA